MQTDVIHDAMEHTRRVRDSAYLVEAYRYVYREMIKTRNETSEIAGVSVEIGASGGFFREVFPEILSVDIRQISDLDAVVDAQQLPFREDSLAAIFAKDVLHHLPNISSFFDDAARCLRKGGVIVCVEPYWGPLARLIYKHFHPEPYNEEVAWRFPSDNPMESNQALLSLLIRRDANVFKSRHHQYEIIEGGPLVGPSYLLSGGARKPSVLPANALIKLLQLESRTLWWRESLALSFMCTFRLK